MDEVSRLRIDTAEAIAALAGYVVGALEAGGLSDRGHAIMALSETSNPFLRSFVESLNAQDGPALRVIDGGAQETKDS